MSEVVVPGDVIGDASSYESGPGTLVCGSSIVSTLVGRRIVDGKVVSVVRGQSETSSLTPQVGDVVLLRVTRVDPKAARGKLLAIGEQPLRGEFGAMIRVQDVRLTLVDKIEMYKCFRPGDVVRGQVLSLGDKRAYFVSTQRNDLGVVGAKCAVSGVPMLAASWETMKCPLTGTVEHRKVAGLTTK